MKKNVALLSEFNVLWWKTPGRTISSIYSLVFSCMIKIFVFAFFGNTILEFCGCVLTSECLGWIPSTITCSPPLGKGLVRKSYTSKNW